jgi:hypothetical protein
MARRSAKKREELLEQYGTRKAKVKPPTYAEIQQSLLDTHKPVQLNGKTYCSICKETIGGVTNLQEYPCLSLQGIVK